MITTTQRFEVTWEKLPADYLLPDDPVDNRTQPLLAEALTDALRSNHQIPQDSITATNYGICATVNGKMVVKAPDWVYVPHFTATPEDIERSYTPQLQGDLPLIVMEFLSETPGGEYSTKLTHPPGKWFFYEQVLRVPVYVIYDPQTNVIECHRLDDTGQYQLQPPNASGHYWLPELDLFLGPWTGATEQRTGHWLRWWDVAGNLLLWKQELLEQERETAQRERETAQRERETAQRERETAQRERDRAEQLLAQLRAAGIEPEAQ